MHLRPGSRHLTPVLCAVISLVCWPLLALGAGGIATDGSLGPRTTLTGPNFTIGANLGQTRGGNLFHSFSTFDLSAGQTATFTGPSSIHDVFARVTGGEPCTIDGKLSCTIPNATFFLIDPNGVMFGPDAKLDVKGSFAVTTADTIKLGTSGSFNASHPAASKLTTAPPAAFGFLPSSQVKGVITVHGTNSVNSDLEVVGSCQLAVRNGKSIVLAGRQVQISGDTLSAPGGSIGVVSQKSGGLVPASASEESAQSSFPGGYRGGKVDVGYAGALDVDNIIGHPGGRIFLEAGNLTVDNGFLVAHNVCRHAGGFIKLLLQQKFKMQGEAAYLDANNFGSGFGASLDIRAHGIDLAGGEIDVDAEASGSAGLLQINAKHVRLFNAFDGIFGETNELGNGADIQIDASDLELSNILGGFGGIITDVNFNDSAVSTTGNAGNISLNIRRSLSIDNAMISANPNGGGAAGTIKIRVGSLTLDQGAISTGSILGIGQGGAINIVAHRISLSNDSTIESTPQQGNSGQISLTASQKISLSGSNTSIQAQVFEGSAVQTTVYLAAPLVTVSNTAQITVETSAFAEGGAGKIDISGGAIKLLSGGSLIASSNSLGNFFTEAPPGGLIDLSARTIYLNDGTITSASLSLLRSNGGGINLYSHDDTVIKGHSALMTSSQAGGGGDIDIASGTDFFMDHSLISATGKKNGGNVQITSSLLALLTGGSKILTYSTGRNGGNIRIDPLDLTLQGDSRISANAPHGEGGDININADELLGVRADLRLGRHNVTATGLIGSGQITNGPANTDIASALAQLPAALASTELTLEPQCGQMLDLSTFLIQGRGGVPEGPGEWQVDFSLSP